MTLEELKAREMELRKELLHLRIRKTTGDIHNPHMISKIRKDIARILTVITEKEKKEKKNA